MKAFVVLRVLRGLRFLGYPHTQFGALQLWLWGRRPAPAAE